MEPLQDGTLTEIATELDPEEWADYYRNPHKFLKAFWKRERHTAGIFRELAFIAKCLCLRRTSRQISQGEITLEELKHMLELLQSPTQERQEFQQHMQEAGTLCRQKLNGFLDSFETDEIEAEADTLNLWGVTVWVPCICLCGIAPDKLFELSQSLKEEVGYGRLR